MSAKVPRATSSVTVCQRSTNRNIVPYSAITATKARSDARYMRPWASFGVCFSSLEHIMGVSVSDTTAETSMVTARVTANSRNNRPTMSPMKSSGISTAISEMVREMMVKPICSAPFSAAFKGASPSSM